MQENKTCSFFGRRNVEITPELYAITTAEIMRSIAYGCRVFYFCGDGAFERLCYEIVTKISTEYPHFAIKRVYCVSQERFLRKTALYFDREKYDEIVCLKRCAVIDRSDFVLFYAEKRKNGDAYKAYRYTEKIKEKYIVDLWTKVQDAKRTKDRA